MYNRYIPESAAYTRVESRDASDSGEPARPKGGRSGGFSFARLLPGAEGLPGLLAGDGGLSGLWRTLKLEDIDKGDVLLLLIVLFLLAEGDDLDLVIALGLVLLMGLGDRGKGPEAEG